MFKGLVNLYFHTHKMCHAKSPTALFSLFMYIMQRTFAMPESESTLHRMNFRSWIYKFLLIFRYSKRPLPNVNKHGEQREDFWRDRPCSHQ